MPLFGEEKKAYQSDYMRRKSLGLTKNAIETVISSERGLKLMVGGAVQNTEPKLSKLASNCRMERQKAHNFFY